MKKQIITIVAVALAAILLFVAYSIFFKPDDILVEIDEFYVLYADVAEALGAIEEEAEITLCGYDSADENWIRIYRFAESIVAANGEFSLDTSEEEGFSGVKVGVGDNVKEIPFESFFKTHYSGVYYAFDGEALFTNAILSLNGKSEMDIKLRALDGFDIEGDQVTSTGAPFVFPALERSKISYLTVTNQHGTYSILQDNNEFYFGSSAAVDYDDEKFSQIVTNMRYNVAYGKMALPEGQSWGSYGLAKPEDALANYTIVTTPKEDGTYEMHTVYIGSLASSGIYYYGRYIGAVCKPVGGSDDLYDDEIITDLSKNTVYFIPVSTVDDAIALPETSMMKPTLINAITETEELFTIQDIRIDYLDEGISAFIENFSIFNPGENLAALNGSNFDDCISDKKSASDYSSYSDGWQNHTDVFGGFTSSDGKATYIQAALARSGSSGEYEISFGLLRDEANGAYLPAKVTVNISHDGNNWLSLENGIIRPEQSDKTVKNYELSFKSDQTVKFVRFSFDVPQIAKTYVVFDEIRIFADGEDAQPVDSINDIWKLVAPSDYIPAGRNYAHLDMSNFNDFLQSMAALTGESVADCGFCDNGDATETLIDKEKLAKYGLDKPARHYSFVYDGITCDIYVSKPTEEGVYYAYSTYTGVIDGKQSTVSTDVIVTLTTETAEWLGWDFVEYLDHSLVSLFISEIDKIDFTFDGNNYEFLLTPDESGANLQAVSHNGKDMDVTGFKYIYKSILSVYMQDEYKPAEGENAEEYFRIKIHSETNSPEIVFYRVSSTKCYFTVDGEGSYYALVEQVNTVREKILAYLAGEQITQ